MTPTLADAIHRAKVRLPSRKVGELIYWPIPIEERKPGKHGGARAKVRLVNDVVVSVDPGEVELVDE